MKFICIGRNYAAHIAELQHAVPTEPVFFLKQENAITRRNRPFFLPDFSQQVDYETEIIVKINRLGKCIQEKFAHLYYEEIGLGVDFTARDLQRRCIQEGNSRDMLFTIDQIIAYVSRFMTLKTGDIIFTGTPVGVGPVHINDRLQGFLEGEKLFDFKVK